jgi:fatty-acyl-CoA synthase
MTRVTDRLAETAHVARVLARSGVFAPTRPDRLARMAGAFRHWGVSLGGLFAAGGARFGDRAAIIDEQGTISFAELDDRTDALARAFVAAGLRAGDVVGVLCRNHRSLIDATGGLAKLGVDILYLNTGFAAPQLREVTEREGVATLVHDDDFAALVADAGIASHIDTTTLDRMIGSFATGPRPPRPERESRTIILTSGTTGTPKGARQQHTDDTSGLALLERIPYRAGETMVVAAPVFHSWGLANSIIGLLLGDTLVLQRHFDPEATLAAIERHRAQVLVAVPVMLMRILELPPEVRARYDTSSLRFVPLSGSALPGHLATEFMDAFGDVVYNLYGSTEVGAVSVANPADLRAAPSTAGRPPRGVDVRLLDDDGRAVAQGDTGRIFVHSGLLFDGYTDGANKIVLDGFMQTGDLGHFDAAGRLFVDGRDDDMIVSGGENVYPAEVEDVIAQLPAVADVAVTGVPDPEWGQRLKAFVIRRPDRALDAEAVRAHVHANLARYKVPRDVEFVDHIPRNTTGKIVKRELNS